MFVWVCTGLTCRCHTIAEAYCLAKKYERQPKLTIIWPKTFDCRIGYHEVFSQEQFKDIQLHIINLNCFDSCHDPCHDFCHIRNLWPFRGEGKNCLQVFLEIMRRASWMFFGWGLFFYMCHHKYYIEYSPSYEMGYNGDSYVQWCVDCKTKLGSMLRKGKKVYVHAYHSICNKNEVESPIKNIIFQERFELRSNAILGNNENVVGVHIRRGGHYLATKESPDESFKEKMKEILQEDSSVVFFLATDDPSVEAEIKKEFHGHILTQADKQWGTDSVEEMESGIIDVLCLSKCKYVLGSFSSVFSAFAAEYGGKELYLCKKRDF